MFLVLHSTHITRTCQLFPRQSTPPPGLNFQSVRSNPKTSHFSSSIVSNIHVLRSVHLVNREGWIDVSVCVFVLVLSHVDWCLSSLASHVNSMARCRLRNAPVLFCWQSLLYTMVSGSSGSLSFELMKVCWRLWMRSLSVGTPPHSVKTTSFGVCFVTPSFQSTHVPPF